MYPDKMKLQWIIIVYSTQLMHCNVFGQKAACNDNKNVLDRCDGRVVSKKNIYIDFGEIRYQCNCMILPNSSGISFYQLATHPDYDNCGTAVRVVDSNNTKYRLPCAIIQSSIAIRNRSSLVELIQENSINGPTNYCLHVRVFTNDLSNIITASCGLSKSTVTDTKVRLTTSKDLPHKSTVEGRNQPTTKHGIQTTKDIMRLNSDYINYSSTVHKGKSTAAYLCKDSPSNGLLIGIVICGILVLILTGIITSLVIYILKSRKRKSTTKNDRNETGIPENMVIYTSPQNRPNSAYTTLNPGQANDPVEQPYTGLNIMSVPEVSQAAFSTRPNSTYTALNAEQGNDNTEQLYTVLTNDPVYNESN